MFTRYESSTTTTYTARYGKGYHWRRYLKAKRADFYNRLEAQREETPWGPISEIMDGWIGESESRDQQFRIVVSVVFSLILVAFVVLVVWGQWR